MLRSIIVPSLLVGLLTVSTAASCKPAGVSSGTGPIANGDESSLGGPEHTRTPLQPRKDWGTPLVAENLLLSLNCRDDSGPIEIPPGGSPLVEDTGDLTVFGSDVVSAFMPTSGPGFSTAWNLETQAVPQNPWNAQLGGDTARDIAAGDVLLAGALREVGAGERRVPNPRGVGE